VKRLPLLVMLSLAAGFGFGPPAWAGADAGRIAFLTPRRFETSAGPSTATLEVVPPPGATIVSVALIADGVPTGTRNSPPWVFAWEAGDGTAEHKLDAVATFSDGTKARASVTSGRRIVVDNEVATPVKVYAIARGAKGAYVDDLGPNDVRLYENGRPQALERIAAERGPLRVAIALDTSASMAGEKLTAATASATAFLGALKPSDDALVLGFSDGVSILQEPTSDRRKLESAIRSASAHGGSSLYDAIYAASDRLAGFRGRRVLLLLADGRDEAAKGRVAASVHTLEEARNRAARNDVMVFVIGLGNYLAHDARLLAETSSGRFLEWDVDLKQPLATILQLLAKTTGGSILFAPRADQIRASFEQIAEDLRHQYVLAYLPSDKKHDDAWREIKVVVDRPGTSITSRMGYFAPPGAPRHP
jgi:Ca-activated chloride channel family protein